MVSFETCAFASSGLSVEFSDVPDRARYSFSFVGSDYLHESPRATLREYLDPENSLELIRRQT